MAYERRHYSEESKFKAGKPFTMNGVQYTFDDPVDMTGVQARQLRLMFDARLIEVDDRPEKARVKHTPKKEVTPSADAAYKAKHKGFGDWYVVNAEGENVAGPFKGKEAAQTALAQLI